MGVAFALPLAFFWLTGRVESRLKPRLLVLLVLGGMQGAIGWWMVASGLVERTDVSQYRLAIHLTLACIIFASILWVARGLVTRPREAPPTSGSAAVGVLIVLMALVQIYLGGLVAGLNAGLSFNTWPLMDGQWIPANLLTMSPVWVNFFENVMTVQFTHRVGAYVLTAVVVTHAVAALALAPGSRHARGASLLVALVVVQAAIGIATLLMAVPTSWALLHQAGAIAVLAGAVMHARSLKGSYAAPATA